MLLRGLATREKEILPREGHREEFSPLGSRGLPLVGDARGQRPLARRRPSRREMSEGVRVQARTTYRMPLTNPRGLRSERCRLRESSTLVPQSGRPLCPTVPHGSASGGKGSKPLDPRRPSHVGFEQTELRRPGRRSSQRNQRTRRLPERMKKLPDENQGVEVCDDRIHAVRESGPPAKQSRLQRAKPGQRTDRIRRPDCRGRSP